MELNKQLKLAETSKGRIIIHLLVYWENKDVRHLMNALHGIKRELKG